MAQPEILFVESKKWRPGLVGDFPGQESFIELGRVRVRMEFCWCPGRKGSGPEHPAIDGFWLAKHLVSQAQWRSVMDSNPSKRGHGDDCPVDSVSWEDASAFCRKAGLRLPMEREWEYACRAGTTGDFAVGSGDSLNSQQANFDGNFPVGKGDAGFKWLYRERTEPGGSFPPNGWGLHDMHGQLLEWCDDKIDGEDRALRGGCWVDRGRGAASGDRIGFAPGLRSDDFGFRPCPSSIQQQVRLAGTAARRGGE